MSITALASHSSGLKIKLAAALDAPTVQMMERLSANGYTEIRTLLDQVCALKHFNFTTAVVVGVDELGYQRRYCYEHRAEAQAALVAWDGRAHRKRPVEPS